jgi:cytochrome c oxidase subunit 4
LNSRFNSSHAHSGHAASGGHDHDEEPHVTPLKVYFAVFAALLVLTVVTVGVSLLGLPPVPSLIVAILVALVKASIVSLWFMHLISEERFYGFILVSTVFFMSLFFVLTLVDLSGRGATNIEETPSYWHKFSHENANKPKEVKKEPSKEGAHEEGKEQEQH